MAEIPRWAIEKGVPADARFVNGRFVHEPTGRVWGLDPDGRWVLSIWHDPAPKPPQRMVPTLPGLDTSGLRDDEIREIARRRQVAPAFVSESENA